MKHARLITLTLLAVALVGCSRVEKDEPDAGTATPAAGASATATAVATASVDPCGDWAVVARSAAGAFNGGPAELRVSVPKAAETYSVFAASAPAPLRPDLEVMAQAWKVVATEMGRVSYEPTRLATDAALRDAVSALAKPPASEAQGRLETWARGNCPVPTSTPTPTARP
jgi:hypothetical protein